MAQITAIDTNVRVAQPELDFYRPRVDKITPILKGISQVTQVFAARKEPPEDILDQHIDQYNRVLADLEAGEQWSNEAIARANRQAKSRLTQDLIKAGTDIKIINNLVSGLKATFESNTKYVVTRKGDRTISRNRDGQVQYSVNDAGQVREDARLDLIASLDPEVWEELAGLPQIERDVRLEKRGDIYFRQQDLNVRVAQAEAEAKLFELSESEKKPGRLRLFNEIKTTTVAAVLQRRAEILVSPKTAEQKEVELQELFSRNGIALANPDAGIVNTIGFTTQAILDAVFPYKLNIEQVRALGETDSDKWSNETMALETQLKLEELRAIAGMPSNIRNKVAVGTYMSQALITYNTQTAFLGENTSEADVMKLLISSNAVVRDEFAPRLDAFFDPHKKGAVEKQVFALELLIKAMTNLSTEDIQQHDAAPILIEEVISVFKLIKDSRGWDTLPLETQQDLQSRYNLMLNVTRKHSPKALEVFQNNLNQYLDADPNLGFWARRKAKKTAELPIK